MTVFDAVKQMQTPEELGQFLREIYSLGVDDSDYKEDPYAVSKLPAMEYEDWHQDLYKLKRKHSAIALDDTIRKTLIALDILCDWGLEGDAVRERDVPKAKEAIGEERWEIYVSARYGFYVIPDDAVVLEDKMLLLIQQGKLRVVSHSFYKGDLQRNYLLSKELEQYFTKTEISTMERYNIMPNVITEYEHPCHNPYCYIKGFQEPHEEKEW